MKQILRNLTQQRELLRLSRNPTRLHYLGYGSRTEGDHPTFDFGWQLMHE
jgi:hypothetical protein